MLGVGVCLLLPDSNCIWVVLECANVALGSVTRGIDCRAHITCLVLTKQPEDHTYIVTVAHTQAYTQGPDSSKLELFTSTHLYVESLQSGSHSTTAIKVSKLVTVGTCAC